MMTADKPAIGTIVKDNRRRAFGRVMAHEGPYVQLRPVAGGREWDAMPDDLSPATTAESLSAGVAVANARSRGECP